MNNKKHEKGSADPKKKKEKKSVDKALAQKADKPSRNKTARNSSRKAGKKKSEGMRKQSSSKKPKYPVKPGKNKLRIIPLGGNEEVGRNMTIFEYENDIILVDMGMQFPEEDMPGVDYIIPNVDYLKGKEKNIKGVVFTHGHLDHIGAAPILLKKLGYPPIIGRDLSLALVKRKLEDYEKGSAAKIKSIRINSYDDTIRLGDIRLKFFAVEHSIMDAVGVIINTPAATAIHMGDWTMSKLTSRGESKALRYDALADLPRPTILMLESLGAIHRGHKVTEEEMWINLERVIKNAPGRVIIATFASQVKRIKDLLTLARANGKKVALDGYSMKMNVEVAKELGYIKDEKEVLIQIKDIHKYPPNRIMIICTGAQGEGNAVLSRIVTENHRFIKLNKADTIIFSSSVVPGNERTVQRLKDDLYRKCDNVIHSDIMDVHIGGHSDIASIQEMVKQVRPDYFLPVYANHFFLKEAAKVVREIGYPGKHIFVLDNGHIIEFDKKGAELHKEKVDTSYVFVDGLGVGDIGQVVLRDRQLLAQDGMFTILVIIDRKTKKIIGSPQITSRGFIYVKENFDLVNATKKVVEKVVKDNTSKNTDLNWEYVKDKMRESVGSYLYTKTQRRPMVLPVVIEV